MNETGVAAGITDLSESNVQSADDHDLGDNHLLDGALDISVPEITGDWKGNVQYSGPDIDLPPETGARAQIILVVTSLGSFRRQFFGSKRAQHLLNCKGYVYHLIDSNRDVTQSIDLKDEEFLKEWTNQGLLSKVDGDDKSRFSIPQVLIDGVSIGDGIDLQDLEEDSDLDWIVVRAACPACLNAREPTDFQCKHCGVRYYELIPPEVIHNKQVQRFARGQLYFDIMPTVHHLRYTDAIANIEHEHVEPESVPYETLFGEPPPTEE